MDRFISVIGKDAFLSVWVEAPTVTTRAVQVIGHPSEMALLWSSPSFPAAKETDCHFAQSG
ncbi:MAG: hypothetical protein ACLSD6_04745 [Clostridium sp.]